MLTTRPTHRRTPWPLAAALLALTAAGPARTPAAIADDMDDAQEQVRAVLEGHPLSDPAKRAAVAPKAIPLVRRQAELWAEMAAARHLPAARVEPDQGGYDAMLYALGDQPTIRRIDAAAAADGGASDAAAHARVTVLRARWLTATNVGMQDNIVDALEPIDAAHPADEVLTGETFNLGAQGAAPDVQDRLVTIATETMKNPLATKLTVAANQLKLERKALAESQAKRDAVLNQPVTIAGTTISGTNLTTADLKGKVILVDFWASWCVPCRAELPHILETYKKYHGQGLEVVGVSNDYGPDPLKTFLAKTGLPWPQLFDAKAADAHELSPLAVRFGVVTLPVMIAIDRRGVCRSVTAYDGMDTLVPKLLAEK